MFISRTSCKMAACCLTSRTTTKKTPKTTPKNRNAPSCWKYDRYSGGRDGGLHRILLCCSQRYAGSRRSPRELCSRPRSAVHPEGTGWDPAAACSFVGCQRVGGVPARRSAGTADQRVGLAATARHCVRQSRHVGSGPPGLPVFTDNHGLEDRQRGSLARRCCRPGGAQFPVTPVLSRAG